MNLADTVAHAETAGWTVTTRDASITGPQHAVVACTRVELETPTHLIFTWWAGDLFFGGTLHDIDPHQFDPYEATVSVDRLIGWVDTHATTRVEAAA